MTRQQWKQRQDRRWMAVLPSRMQGIGLLETLLLLFVLGGAVVAGSLWVQVQVNKQAAEQQTSLLKQADRQLRGYAAANYALPCPAFSNTDGVATCGRGAKGLLPWRTLGIDAADARGSLAKLGYITHTKAAALSPLDLTNAAHRFATQDWDGKKVDLDTLTINTLDFCDALKRAAADVDTTTGKVSNGTTSRYVAYALAHPGMRDADGDGKLFDGLNATSATDFEFPERGTSSGYDDQVLVTTFGDLAREGSCQTLMDSIDGLTLSVNVIDEVRNQKGWATAMATILTTVNIVKLGVQVIKTITSGIALGAAVTVLGTAVAELGAAILGCVFFVGCADIPRALAATVAGVAATVQGALAVAANVAADISHATATALTATVMIKAGLTIQDSNIDYTEAMNKSCKARDDAQGKLPVALKNKNDAIAEYNTNVTNQGNAWGDMLGLAHNLVAQANNAASPKTNKPVDRLDHLFYNPLNTDVDDWIAKERLKAEAEENLKKAKEIPSGSSSTKEAICDKDTNKTCNQLMIDKLQKQIDDEKAKPTADQDTDKIKGLEDAITTLRNQTSAANSTAKQIQSLKDSIADLQTRIDNESDPAKKADLQNQQSSLQNQLATLDSGVDGKQAAFDAASKAARDAEIKLFGVNGNAGSKEDVIWTFWTALDYCVTTPAQYDKDGKKIKDESTDCSGRIDGRSAMRVKVTAYIDALKKSTTSAVKVSNNTQIYDQALDSYNQAETACQRYINMLPLPGVPNPWGKPTTTPQPVTDWMGAGDIMREAYKKGGVK